MAISSPTRYESLLSTRAKLTPAKPKAPVRGIPADAPRPLYAFDSGRPDPDSFPLRDMVEATKQALSREGREALTYGAPMGYEGLRELVCDKTKHYEGFVIEPSNVLITNGSSHALGLIAAALVDVGDTIITEAPTFSGTLNTFRRLGPKIVGVSVDAEGMRTDELEERLRELARQGIRPKLIYTIVNFQNPSGPTLSLTRRNEMIRLADEFGTIIVEDDAYGELRYSNMPVRAVYDLDTNNRTVRAGTLSKILGAGVRLGWVVAPTDLLTKIAAMKDDGGTNPYMSRVATYYLRAHMHAHVEELRAIYQAKRDTMVGRLKAGLGASAEVSNPDGGFFIWIHLPKGTDPDRLVVEAAHRCVQYVPGPSFFPDGSGSDYIRLAFSYANLVEIKNGTDLLCEAIHAAGGE